MASGTTGPDLRALFESGTAAGLSDRELLERVVSRRDAGAEVAFTALVERHGAMVLRACREVLRDPHDAEDAFQAAFLVLARRAGSIRNRESVGPWLHGVALRVARCARSAAARRRAKERRVAEGVGHDPGDVDRLDVSTALHEEVGRLPETYRAAVVLCYFEGLTHEQAAGQLGWPVGTVRSRLAWARARLRSRLTRRGLAPSAAFLAGSASADGGAVVVGAAFAKATVRVACGSARAGAVPASVAALSGQVLKGMLMTKLTWVATGVVAAGLVTSAGVGLVAARQAPGRATPKPSPPRVEVEATEKSDPPTTDEARRSPVRRAGDTSETPRTLAARFEAARRTYRSQEPLAGAEIPRPVFDRTRAEIDLVAARIEDMQDDLRDELELLTAQLAIRKADLRIAQALVDQAHERVGRHSDQVKQGIEGPAQLAETHQEVSVRQMKQDMKLAEVNEIVIRIRQVERRRKAIDPLVKEAKDFVAKSGRPAHHDESP